MQIDLKGFIRDVPDFPKPGIMFKDISPLLRSPEAFVASIEMVRAEWEGKIDAIAALDARGFLFGAPLAIAMQIPFSMLRKKGKLPGETIGVSYDLEYGSAELEVEGGAFAPGARVLVVDDLLATGGTAAAACALVGRSGAQVAGCAFVIELMELGGRGLLKQYAVQSLVAYEKDQA